MPVKFIKAAIPGVWVIEPEVFEDPRGFFMETYHRDKYRPGRGMTRVFVQDNHSHSRQGVLRGLHYQLQRAQDKLVFAVTGEIFDVVVDIRQGSPTFGQWFGIRLAAEKHQPDVRPPGICPWILRSQRPRRRHLQVHRRVCPGMTNTASTGPIPRSALPGR